MEGVVGESGEVDWMNKREILLCTIGLPFVIMLVLAIFMVLFGDPLEEEDCCTIGLPFVIMLVLAIFMVLFGDPLEEEDC